MVEEDRCCFGTCSSNNCTRKYLGSYEETESYTKIAFDKDKVSTALAPT